MALLFKLRTDHLMDMTTGIVANRATETPVSRVIKDPLVHLSTPVPRPGFWSSLPPKMDIYKSFSFNHSIIQSSALAQAYHTLAGGGR